MRTKPGALRDHENAVLKEGLSTCRDRVGSEVATIMCSNVEIWVGGKEKGP